MLNFVNPGEIDIRGATIAGLSAKNIDSPIGFFGTGLKYSIACILRWGGSIKIFSGLKEYNFTSEEINFRGNTVSQILMNSEPIGFTTEYGKTWEPWQVFRELYSNALDEGGTVSKGLSDPKAGFTTILVECFQVDDEFNNKDIIILSDTCPRVSNDDLEIFDKRSQYLYYRKVRVYEHPCLFTYNLKNDVTLTEDRSIQYIYSQFTTMGTYVAKLEDEDLIYKILNAPTGTVEGSFTFSQYISVSPQFEAIARRLYKLDPSKYGRLEPLLRVIAPEVLEPQILPMSQIKQKMLDKAMAYVARMGLNTNVPVEMADLGQSCLGKYMKASDKIFIDPKVFDQGTKQIVSTLYEEFLHAQTGKVDCTYDLQTYLFNQIISLYEEFVFQEPI
jgi:hypothetical protein